MMARTRVFTMRGRGAVDRAKFEALRVFRMPQTGEGHGVQNSGLELWELVPQVQVV